MANLTATLSIDGSERTALQIRPGESIGPVPLTWQNSDGTERSMVGATARWRLIAQRGGAEVVAPTSIADPASLYISGATTTAWARGTYLLQVWEERLAGQPLERDNEGEITLTVLP